ncbi:hypothetical protein VNO77_45140 [Canavalia gladiata]|uniref:Uncharacterized protein n=1 Tax=Canavalia gladiata TaxID=3824 RepID=A0AAN9JU64_CANGL
MRKKTVYLRHELIIQTIPPFHRDHHIEATPIVSSTVQSLIYNSFYNFAFQFFSSPILFSFFFSVQSLGRSDSESWPKRYGSKSSVSPEGCFSVYVGPEMQRFVIKTEYANHPLFKILLEEAESEYGYNSHGPLALPCHVDVFYKVLMEMEDSQQTRQPCAFLNRSQSAYQLLSPSPMLTINHF